MLRGRRRLVAWIGGEGMDWAWGRWCGGEGGTYSKGGFPLLLERSPVDAMRVIAGGFPGRGGGVFETM